MTFAQYVVISDDVTINNVVFQNGGERTGKLSLIAGNTRNDLRASRLRRGRVCIIEIVNKLEKFVI